MTKTGGIFPLLAAIPTLIASAAPAVAKAAALGKGIVHKEGKKRRQTRKQKPTRRSTKITMPQPNRLRLPVDQYGAGLRLPGTSASWYPKH